MQSIQRIGSELIVAGLTSIPACIAPLHDACDARHDADAKARAGGPFVASIANAPAEGAGEAGRVDLDIATLNAVDALTRIYRHAPALAADDAAP